MVATVPLLPMPVPPGPLGTELKDLDLVNESFGYTLGRLCSAYPVTSASQCKYQVAPSVDNGPAHPFGRVGPVLPSTDSSAPRAIHFLSPTDGFAYGSAGAYVTHDAVETWQDAGLGKVEVASITGRGNVAWAVTRNCAGATCPFSARLSTDAGRSWSQPHALPGAFSPVGALAFDSGGLVVWSSGGLVLTSDGGTKWNQISGQCTGDGNLRGFAVTPDGQQMWQLCQTLVADEMDLYLSEDLGKTWSVRPGHLNHSAGVTIAAPSVGTVVVGSIAPTVVSHDSGLTWNQASVSGVMWVKNSSASYRLERIKSIRFSSSTEGWALDTYDNIWASHDGGDNWTLGGHGFCAPAPKCIFEDYRP